MVEETVEQLKRLHAIEDVEHAIFALERGMPAPPKIIDTLKVLLRVMAIEYNNQYVNVPDQEPAEPGTD